MFKIWGGSGLPKIKTYSPNLENFGPWSRDTMHRHASTLYWCTCKVVLPQLCHVCR